MYGVADYMVPEDVKKKLEEKITFADMKTKSLVEHKESLQKFANTVLSSKIARNEVKKLGEIDNVVIEDMKNNGIDISSNDILISDKIILKYLNHPKGAKGAVVDFNRFYEIEKLVIKPTNIYEDTNSKALVYAYTSPYDDEILKAIIHPNYKMSGNTINLLKSIGIVDKTMMNNNIQYRKIK